MRLKVLQFYTKQCDFQGTHLTDTTMHVIDVEKRTCTEEAFKDIQNLNVVLLHNLPVVSVEEDSLKGQTLADMLLIYTEML